MLRISKSLPYTQIIGFKLKEDVPIGEHRWITVGHSDNELELVSNLQLILQQYQETIYKDYLATMFYVDNIDNEYKLLTNKGVIFKSPPAKMGMLK